jgi:hypothetical protein
MSTPVAAGSFDPKSMVLGAVLAIATSLIVKLWEIWISDRRARTRLKLLLRGEIKSICDTIDRLRSESLGFIPLVRIFEIGASRQGFDRNSEWVGILKEVQFREDVTTWYRDLAVVAVQVQALEGTQAPEAGTEQFARDERARLLNRYADLAAKGRSLLQLIDRQ